MATSTTRNTTASPAPATAGNMLVNGVKAIAELGVLPGSSLLVDGDIKSGTLHVVAGLAARAFLGPIGWLAVGADSFSKSVSGKHLHQHFFNVEKVDED
jgi:Family of unknown function (DUF6072)